LRSFSELALGGIGATAFDDYLASQPFASRNRLRLSVVSRLSRLSKIAAARSIGDLSFRVGAHFYSDELNTLVGQDTATRETADVYPGADGEKLCLWDLHNYLPGDILTKVDRATMAVSIEGREPFLDHRLVEFAFSLPFGMRRGLFGGKHLLKKVLYRHVPKALVERPKRGFGVPVKRWLAEDLTGVVSENLNRQLFERQGLLDPGLISSYLNRLRAGDVQVRQRVWLLVAFQMWYRRWMPTP
jgi:asparagine synthase (glutamine-hydrolysing)